MALEKARESKQSAQQVANALAAMLTGRISGYIKLEVVHPKSRETEAWLVTIDRNDPGVVRTLADGSELAHCVNLTGSRIDIIFPEPSARETSRAVVLVEEP